MCDFVYDDGGKCAIPDDRMHVQHFRLVGTEYGDYVDNAAFKPAPPPSLVKPGSRAEAERALRELAKDIPKQPEMEPIRGTGFPAAVAESERSAQSRWVEHERAQVAAAIRAVAERHFEFTTDLVWQHLNGAVPVTKGMTAMLQRAKRDGIIASTDRTVIAQRGGEHDHAQRLTVWHSLICETRPMVTTLRDFG